MIDAESLIKTGERAIEDRRDTDTPAQAAGEAIMDALEDYLKANRSGSDMRHGLASGSEALAEIAERVDDPLPLATIVEDRAKTVAQVASTRADNVEDPLMDALEPVLEDAREDAFATADYSLDVGIGLDELLEHHLDEVVIQRSTDALDDPTIEWHFDDGTTVETADGVYHEFYPFYKQISRATPRRVARECTSELVLESIKGGVATDQYARLSLGPEDRPWTNQESTLWSQAISGLIDERSRTETVVGVRTEAWEGIQSRIASRTAVRAKDDAVAQGMIRRDDANDELWIPTAVVKDVTEPLELSRMSLQSELSARGIESANVGGGISEPVTAGGATARFWRVDASHDDVPEPDAVVDELNDPTTRAGSPTPDTDTDDVTNTDDDTDTDTDGGAEEFGRGGSDE